MSRFSIKIPPPISFEKVRDMAQLHSLSCKRQKLGQRGDEDTVPSGSRDTQSIQVLQFIAS
jgi:hypothetical protein